MHHRQTDTTTIIILRSSHRVNDRILVAGPVELAYCVLLAHYWRTIGVLLAYYRRTIYGVFSRTIGVLFMVYFRGLLACRSSDL